MLRQKLRALNDRATMSETVSRESCADSTALYVAAPLLSGSCRSSKVLRVIQHQISKSYIMPTSPKVQPDY